MKKLWLLIITEGDKENMFVFKTMKDLSEHLGENPKAVGELVRKIPKLSLTSKRSEKWKNISIKKVIVEA